LALSVPQWWRAFQAKFRIYWQDPEPVYLNDDEAGAPVATPAPRRRPRRRAVAF
jgi:hypothetical protein